MSGKEINEAIQRRIPNNTWKTTEWVVTVFRSWYDARGDIDKITIADKLAERQRTCFARTRAALDVRMKQLTKEGMGTVRKRAEPLTRVFWYNCNLLSVGSRLRTIR